MRIYHSLTLNYYSLTLFVAALVVFTGCDVAPTTFETSHPSFHSSLGDVSALATSPLGGVSAFATGGGRYEPTATPGFVWTVSFSALQRDPSTLAATGHWQYRIDNWEAQGGVGSVDLRGDITCLATDLATGRAWLGGVTTHNGSTHPLYNTEPGAGAWFRVVDDGEGHGVSQHGRMAMIFGEHFEPLGIENAQAWCETQFWHDAGGFMGPIRGNIQVR